MGLSRWVCGIWGRLQDRRREKQRHLLLQQYRKELHEEMALCRQELCSNDMLFALTGDPHMIESCIYRRKALRARLDSLTLQARRLYEEYGEASVPGEDLQAEMPCRRIGGAYARHGHRMPTVRIQ